MTSLRGWLVRGNPSIREMPWYPEWTADAACAGMDVNLFFDYGRSSRRIAQAKEVCNSCPVRIECLETNMKVPMGIFGGLTAIERWRLRGKSGYPNKGDAYRYFAQFYGKSDPSHRPLRDQFQDET